MTETLMVWLPSLLISLLAVVVFLYLAYYSRAQIDRVKRKAQEDAEQFVERFLQRESRMTRHRLQTPMPTTANSTNDPARWLAHLRRCWLDAELAALVNRGQRNSDYELLQKAAMPLLRLTQRSDSQSKPTPSKWSSAESKQYLQKTRAAVNSQKAVIQEFKARKATADQQPTNKDALSPQVAAKHNDFYASLSGVENNTATLLETIEKLEHELAAAQNKYDAVNERLLMIQSQKSVTGGRASQAAGHVIISTEADKGDLSEGGGDLLNEMESAYTNSLTEMKKMSDINHQQRHLIFQMEKELALLRKDSTEYQVSSEVLDKLKLQLRDYENCTTILEMESETLREQIQNLRQKFAKSDSPEESAAVSAEQGQPSAVAENENIAAKENGALELIEAIAAAASLEGAGAQLVAWLTKQDISSVIYIKGKQEQIWVSSEGSVDDHSKQLLRSVTPVAGQPIMEVREGVMFIYPVFRVLLYGKGDFHEKNSKMQRSLRDIFATTDHILLLFQEKLGFQQSHQLAAAIQKKLHSLAVQHNYIDLEHARTGANIRKEIDEYLITADTTEVQKKCIDTMLEDFDSQLEILLKTGKLIEAGLRTAIQDVGKLLE